MQVDIPLHPPVTAPTFCILLGLSPGKRHGHGILKNVEALGGGEVSLRTLYTGLRRLLSQDSSSAFLPTQSPGRVPTCAESGM